MKIMFLISLAFFSISLNASNQSPHVDSFLILSIIGNNSMPRDLKRKLSPKESPFTTFKHALYLAKFDALSSALEEPENDNGMRLLCSAFSYNATLFLKHKTGHNEISKTLLEKFVIYSSDSENNYEAFAIQDIARKLMSYPATKDLNLCRWLKDNKNLETVNEVVSYINDYSQTKDEYHIQALSLYFQDNA